MVDNREEINREIDVFSVDVLRYNRQRPRDGQRLPGDVLYDIDQQLQSAKERHLAVRKGLGAFLMTVITAVTVAALTGSWPAILKLLGSH